MSMEFLMLIWGGGLLLTLLLLIRTLKGRSPDPKGSDRRALAWVLTAASVVPSLIGLVLLVWMYFGGGHPTAQMTGSSSLWSMWFHAWPALMLGNLAGGVAVALTFAVFWHPRRDPKFFVVRLLSLGG